MARSPVGTKDNRTNINSHSSNNNRHQSSRPASATRGPEVLRSRAEISVCLATVVYDSAQHPATARDINFHFTRDLGLERPTIVAHARQFRGSAECGLHVFLVGACGAWAALGTRSLPQVQLTPPRHISLSTWRTLLADGRPLSRHLTALLADTCTDFASLIGFDDTVRGGTPATDGASAGSPLCYPLNVPDPLVPV